MRHKIERVNTASDCESFIEGKCSCGWTTGKVSNMHNSQLTVLNNMEINHLRLADRQERDKRG